MRIFKKIAKWVLRVILIIIGVLLLISILVYIPPIHNFIKDKAASYVSANMGIHLEIEKIRLRFPLTLSIDNTMLRTVDGDTLLSVGGLRAQVSILPLLGGSVEARNFTLTDASINYGDSLSMMVIRGSISKIGLRNLRIKLSKNDIKIGGITISDATLDLRLGESVADSTSTTSDTIPWKISADKLDMEQLIFNMHTSPSLTEMAVKLEKGRIENADVDMSEQSIYARLVRLDNGHYSYLTDSVNAPPQIVDTTPQTESRPWTINVGRVELTGNSASYGTLYGSPAQGFDPSHIEVSDVNIRADSVYNRSSDISLVVRRIELRERSGVAITGGQGSFTMDSDGIRLSDFLLATATSRIQADISAGAGILNMNPEAAFVSKFNASVGAADLFLLYPFDTRMRQTLRNKTLVAEGDIEGSLSDISINTLRIAMPSHINLSADGHVRSLTDLDNMSGNLRFDGRFADLNFIKPLLPDSLQSKIGFPRSMHLAGSVAAEHGSYLSDLRLTADSGHVEIKGELALRSESYDATIAVVDLPIYTFLPTDSLGLLSLNLTATGQGFDLAAQNTSAEIGVNIVRFDYKGYNNHDISLGARLAENSLTGELKSANEALQLDIDLGGKLSKERYAAHLRGRITKVDLMGLRLSQTPFRASGLLDISASASPDTTQMIYSLDATLDSIRFTHGEHMDAVGRTTIKADAGTNSVMASIRSGDLSLDFNSPLSLTALMGGFTQVADTLIRQFNERDIDFKPIEDIMPTFTLDLNAGRKNVAHSILAESDMGFDQLTLTAYNTDTTLFRIRGLATGVHAVGLTLDTLNMGLGKRDEQLTYFVRLANKPGNIEQLALIYLYGTVKGNNIEANFNQRNRDGQKGFVFGVNAQLRDSSIRASIFPENPTFAYETWAVNDSNFLEYRFNNEMYANIDLTSGNSHIKINSVDYSNMPKGSILLDIANLDIGKTLDLLPAPPPVGGLLNSNIAFGLHDKLIAANGSAGLNGLTYEKRTVGDIGMMAITNTDGEGMLNVDMELKINENSAVSVIGTYDMAGDSGMNLNVTLPAFPLNALNAFFPVNMAQLAGILKGNVRLRGAMENIDINGNLNFDDGLLTVPMVGTTFGISSKSIRISRNKIYFNDFGFTSPNKQLLAMGGTVDIADFSNMNAALVISGNNFQIVNAPRNRGSQIYGLASANMDMTARGKLDKLVLKGDIKLLRTTDVVYTMKDSPLSVTQQQQELVTFISFADTTAMAMQDSVIKVRTGGMDMLVNVDLEDEVQATVNLSDNGNDRIELIGGGNLTFTMSNQGDTRLTGRYTLSGGTVVYNPPIIPRKEFTISPDSYVAWTGKIANPEFRINAVDVMRAEADVNGTTQNVDFNVIVNIDNSLEDMALAFDLSAPSNTTIQNQLASMEPEQRSQRAISLMAFGKYVDIQNLNLNTLIGGGGGDPTAMLNSFIVSELNQWARNTLKGIDLSLGMQSNEDAGGSHHTDYSYKVSKNLFNDRVKVTIGGSISDNTSAMGNVKENFVDDISLEYRLTKYDNMFVRMYRNNTQESILEGEVIETGGGFLYRKKMEKLSNLFKLNKNLVKREVRDIKRDSRRELREEELQSIRDTSRRYNPGAEGDSIRRTRMARRDSLGQTDSTYRRRRSSPRDPSRFDSLRETGVSGIQQEQQGQQGQQGQQENPRSNSDIKQNNTAVRKEELNDPQITTRGD